MKMQWKSIPHPVFFKVSLCPSGQYVTRSPQLKARPVKRRSVLARRCLCIWLLAAVFVGSAHGQPSDAICTSSSGFLNDSSLCPAIYPISMASGGGGLPLTHLTHLTFCLKDAQMETVGFRVPSARMQALVVVQSLDGLWRKVSFEPDSRSCRRCASCSAANDTLPICSSSGCAGCPLTGVLRISAELLPPPPLLAAMAARQAGLTEAQFLKEYRDQNTEDDLEVVFLCVLAALPGVVTQVALPLRVHAGARDACGVCGGDNTTCAGCDGVPNSGSTFDLCNRCARPGSGTWNSCLGCDGVLLSGRGEDTCGVCGGDNSSCLLTAAAGFRLLLLSPRTLLAPANASAADKWARQPHVCAGDRILVAWRAGVPAGASTADRFY